MVAAGLFLELTSLLFASRPVADQELEMGRLDPHVVPLGTVPETVTVIEALALAGSVKPVQVMVWLPLMLTVPVAGLVVAVAFDIHPAVLPWSFMALRSPPVQFWVVCG